MGNNVTVALASNFLDSLGVNVHSGETGAGAYGNTSLTLKSLNYLGIHNVRTSLPSGNALGEQINALANAGTKFDFVTSSDLPAAGKAGLTQYVDTLATFDTKHPGSVSAVEGLNEVNIYDFSWQGDSSIGGAVAFQQALYTAVKGNTALNGVGVINLSIGYESSSAYAQEGNVARWSDYANAHAYTDTYQTQQQSMQVSIGNAKAASAGDPLMVTETGYTTSTDNACLGVSEHAQAELTLTNLMNAFADGSQKTYLYELFNSSLSDNEVSWEKEFGLFNADGSPKQVAAAIHNLTTILTYGDAADATLPANGSWSLVKADGTMHSLALAKSASSYDIVLWSDMQAWDQVKGTDATVTPTQQKVHFGSVQANVYVYDPLAGTAPVAVYHNVSDITVPVGASPLIVEVGASGPVQDAAPVAPAHYEASSADFMAGIDRLAMSTGVQTVTLDGSHDLQVANVATMNYIIGHYGTLLGKISGGYQFVTDHATDQWREVCVFDSKGGLVSTVDYGLRNGVAQNSLEVMADGTRVSTDLTTNSSMKTATDGTVMLTDHINGVLTSSRTTAKDGNVWTATFDTSGHKLTEGHSGPDGGSTFVNYDAASGNQTRVASTDTAGDHFVTTYASGKIDVHYAQFADGHNETIQYNVTGSSFTKLDQITDSNGHVLSVSRFHADGTTDSTEWHAVDGNQWLAWYDAAGKLQTTLHQGTDGTSQTAYFDTGSGQITRAYNVAANGDKITDVYGNGAVTQHYVSHADGTTENVQYGVTGQSFTTQYQSLDANGHLVSLTRTHADGTFDFFEWDYADGRRDLNSYDAAGKLATTAHYAADKSWTLLYAADTSGDTRTEMHDTTGALTTTTVAHRGGAFAQNTYATGQTIGGGAGNDVFALYGANSTVAFAGGNDTVNAFRAGDHIHFSADEAKTMADVHLTQTSGGVLVSVHGGSLLLTYTALDHVPDGTFLFG